MKNILTKIIFLLIALQLFFSCRTTKIEKPTQIEVPRNEVPKTIKIEDMYYFFLAGDNLWIFFNDRFEIIKSPTEKDVVFFERFKSEKPCILKPLSRSGVRGFTDCIPRPPRMRPRGRKNHFTYNFEKGYWVLQDEVVVQLGKQLYFFTFNGKFLRIENREKGWQFEVLPDSKYDWRFKDKTFFFKNEKFEFLSAFSDNWALKRRGKNERRKIILFNRSTAENVKIFEASEPTRGSDWIDFREYGEGFYIDRRLIPAEAKNKIEYPPTRPLWWFGKTTIDLKNDDPLTYCYVFQEKKKCIPSPNRFLRGVLETEKMLIMIYTKKLEVEFKQSDP